MKIASQGSYPKIPAGPGPSVRAAIQRFDRGQGTPADLDRTYRDVTRRVLDLSREVGLDLATDGQIRANDWFDPVVRDVDNVYSEGLLRLYDNNFYYRHPVVRGRLAFQGGTLAYWTRQAVAMSQVPLKAVLPGPFTFLALSEDQSYHDRERWLTDLVAVLKLERDALAATGIAEIQWDEPELARTGSADAARVGEVLGSLLDGATVPQSLALFWGRKSHEWLRPLASLPLARVYIDTVADPAAWSGLADERWPYEVGVGAVDARGVRLEDPADVADRLEPVLTRQSADRVWLTPTSGLELLPPDRAESKLRLLAAVRRAVDGKSQTKGEGR